MAAEKTSYLKFLLNSTTEHGVHSPFVYRLITECFYPRELRLLNRDFKKLEKSPGFEKTDLLYRLVLHFKPAKLLVLGDNAAVITEVLRFSGESNRIKVWFFSTLAPIPGGIDLAYISHHDKAAALDLFEQVIANSHNDTVCIVDNIHTSAQDEEIWQAIKKHPKVTVTVDIYAMGLVFFRREQAHQHFNIRPSKNALRDAVLGLRKLYGLID